MAGVSAATGVMNSLLCKLAAVLGEEYRLLKGVRKQVQFLESELSSMNTLLRMLADMENVDSLTREWRDKVRELSYDIEDCIDLFLHHHGDAEAGFARRTVRRLKGLWLRHQIGNQIQELKNRVMEESERRLRYTLDQRAVMANTDHISVAIDPRVPALYTEAKGLVATDGPSDEIVQWLMDEQEEVKVVSVVGCGGLGKTTLAMEVYRKIDKRFQCSASVSVSRTLDLKKLLKDVFYQINPDAYRQSQAWEEEHQSLIIAQLRQYLQDKRLSYVEEYIYKAEQAHHNK
uniref:Rx N-terminal domain-containing protein n=1 Tax=Oryza punctata TaxID=4537 RepID=A0A0E0LRZ4_ORYPU